MAAETAREVTARNRWHAVWVMIRESFRHPNTRIEIRIERRSDDHS